MMDMPEDWLRDLRGWASARNDIAREFWLFGSRADGHARPDSDVDVAFVLRPDTLGDFGNSLGIYTSLGDRWQRELQGIIGRHVSLEAVIPNTAEDECIRTTGLLLWRDASAQTIVRCDAASARDVFAGWLDSEAAAGLRLVTLEGAMLAGKSTLTEQPFPRAVVEVDSFIHHADPYRSFIDAVKRAPLIDAIRAALATSPLVVVEGAIVWPLRLAAATETPLQCVRRVYLKRMKWSEPDRWHDGQQFLDADAVPRYATKYSNSVDRYHRDHQPWQAADLVIERIEAEDEDDQ